MSDVKVEASGVTETSTRVAGGLDVDVALLDVDEEVAILSGEVTMVRDRANGGWRPYGDEPALWVESYFLEALKECYPGPTLLRAALDLIEDSAAAACEAYRAE